MKPNLLLRVCLATLFVTVPCSVRAENAPHGDADEPKFHWAPAAKDFLGTAMSAQSQVYFTGAEGVLTEVFYPSPDTPQNVDLQLLVVDAARTYGPDQAEERKQTLHKIEQPDPRAMLWVSTITNPNHWQTIKEIYTDPDRNSIIEDVTFQVLDPAKTVQDFNVYVLNKPAINEPHSAENRARQNNARTQQLDHRSYLCVSLPNSTSSALVSDLPWKTQSGHEMISSGYFGVNDGWTDLFGGNGDRTMDSHFDGAYNGNVTQMGWLDFSASTAREIKFKIVLSFGQGENEAMSTAKATLDNFASCKAGYVAGWHNYVTSTLQPGMPAEFYLAAMTLKSSADKVTGAMVAGLGTPWGEDKDDPNGYHRVWSRDLFKFSSALFAAGDRQAAAQVVTFLFTKQILPDGHFPRYGFTDGKTLEESNVQMDQTALPIVLAWRLHEVDPAIVQPLGESIRKAAEYLLANGPGTGTERWEEQPGFSPSTIASEIAGLICAADLAEKLHIPNAHPADYRRTADFWRGNLTTWLVTENGPLKHPGTNERYYLRLNANSAVEKQDPDADTSVPSSNGIPAVDKRRMVDNGFLELPRFGVLSPNDWSIVESLKVTDDAGHDQVLRQRIVGKGDGFFRYDYDGYGQRNDGAVWDGANGRGRLWPILTAERGIYEIEKAHAGGAGADYLTALLHFASPAGFIPEQVYGNAITFQQPTVDVSNPTGMQPGDSTGSIRPLSWAMGEYINLLLASRSGHNDAPQVVKDRYRSTEPQVTVNFTCTANTQSGEFINLVGDSPLLGDNDDRAAIRLKPLHYPDWTVTVSLPAGSRFKYHFFRYVPNQANAAGQTFEVFADPAAAPVNVQQTLP